MVLQVGKLYPDMRYRHTEGAIIAPNEQNFDFLINIEGITEAERKAFAKGKLRYGVYTEGGIPFLILDLPDADFTCDAPLNFFKLDATKREAWAKSEANSVMLISIEKKNFNVLSMRLIGLQPSLVAEFKNFASQQTARYVDAKQVDIAINNILSRLTTAQMIAKTKMYTL